MKRGASWRWPISGLAALMLCLLSPVTQAQQAAPAVKSSPAPTKIAAKPAKPKPPRHEAVAAAKKPAQPTHKLAVRAAKPKPVPQKLAASAKKPAPVKVATAPAPPAAPSYTMTTIRDGVTVRTTKIIVSTAAKPAPMPVVTPVSYAKPLPPAAKPPLAPIAAASAAAFVTAFLDDAFRIARAADASALQRRARLGALFAGNMAIADIAGYTTGEKLAAQPADFQRQFRSILIGYLVETYYPKIEAASDRSVSVEITPEPPLADGTAVVWTTFTKDGWGSQSVKWHLASSGGAFKVADTFSGGASLVEMERATFQSVMRSGGVSGLMAKLDARTRELASAASN